MSQFLILAIVVVVLCAIGCAIDYFNSPVEKRSSVLVGYVITLGAALFAAWGLDNIHDTIIKSVAIAALVFFGRYLMRKYANRKA